MPRRFFIRFPLVFSAQRPLQRLQQRLAGERLEQHPLGADAIELLEHIVVPQGGDHENLGLVVFVHQDLGRLQPINAGHDDIHGHQIGLDFLIGGNGSLAVPADGRDLVARLLQQLFQLQFGPRKAKKIAYAASMGGFRLTNGYQRHFFGKYLRGFDYISLREQDGVDECRALGFSKARLVPDPTLLIEAEQYRAISEKPAIAEGKKYVLLYLLGNPIDVEVDEIAAWARSKQYELIYTASQGREDEFAKYDATPQEWLGLIDHAEAVITNSFHGMVFSILFNKPFLVIPISGAWSRMNSRLTTTLDELHIDRTHIYAGDPNRVNAPIDYAAANRIIEEKRAQIRTELEAVLHR